MKKHYFLTLLMALCCAMGTAMADTYKVDFETTVDTSDHEFKVATGWSHIVDFFKGPIWIIPDEYVAYSYEAGAGVDGSTALKVGGQTLTGKECNDLLVTPKVSGTVSIMVKSTGEEGANVKFFAMQGNTMGSEITPAEAPALTIDGYVKYVLPEQNAANIGIRCENVFVDDFEAASAVIELSRSMNVVSATLASDNDTYDDNSSLWSVTYINTDAEGNYTLSYDIELKNNGEVPLNTGDEGYSISLYSYDNNRDDIVLGENLPVSVALQPGETKTVNFKLNVKSDKAVEGETVYVAIKENVTGTETERNYDINYKVKYNAPVVLSQALTITAAELQTETFTDTEGNTCVVADADGNYTLTYNVTVKNTGTDPLTVGTEGYSIQLTSASGFGYEERGDPVNITVNLAPEEETTVVCTVELNRQETYQVTATFRENISQTTFETQQTITPADDPNVEKRTMAIDNVVNKTNTHSEFSGFSYKTYTDTDADGNFTIEADVTVRNTGNVTLTDDEVLISLFNYADPTQVFTTAKMGQDLEPGQTATVNLKVVLNIAQYPDVITYYVKENVSNTTEFAVSTQAYKPVTTVDVTIGEDGWASFCSDKALSFGNCEGLTVYVVTNVEDGMAQLAEVTEIPAYTGVLLQGAEGTYTADIVADAEAPEQNLLRASIYGTEVSENSYDAPYGTTYVFGKNSEGTIGFVKGSEGYTIGAGKAYLVYDEGEAVLAREFIAIFDNTATAITATQAQRHEGTAFNLRGQQVNAAYRGIVVRNGRKYVNK